MQVDLFDAEDYEIRGSRPVTIINVSSPPSRTKEILPWIRK